MASGSEPTTEQVVLVDEADLELGTMEKLAAHQAGLLHRAMSVFVFDQAGRLLVQRRAAGKYHSGGLWTNTCCGHPRPGEPPEAAARRRLREEMGFTCELRTVGTFLYRAGLEGGLTEHELDHLFIGRWEGSPAPDPVEADAWAWRSLADLSREIDSDPDRFTAWFRLILRDPATLRAIAPGQG